MTTPRRPEELALLRDDLAYHQARVLLLVTAVADARGHQGKVDGLTKLAKLDFLLRYPALAALVLDRLDPADLRTIAFSGTAVTSRMDRAPVRVPVRMPLR